jgi:hypothetical protein
MAPSPVTMLTTPGGRSVVSSSSPIRSVDSGDQAAGLATTVLPVASAGPSFHASCRTGPFQAVMAATTPSG